MEAMLFSDPRWKQMRAPKSNRMAQGQHEKLLRLYGSKAPRNCGECEFLVDSVDYRKTYYKCACAHMSSSASSDWRKKWEACGLFKEKEPEKPP